MISVVSQKSMVVKNQTVFMILVVSQKGMVVKTKQFSWFRWLVKKVWWLKQNSFHDCGG